MNLLFVLTDTEADTSKMLAESVERDQAPTQAAATNPVKTEDKNGQTSSAVVSGKYLTVYDDYHTPQTGLKSLNWNHLSLFQRDMSLSKPHWKGSKCLWI